MKEKTVYHITEEQTWLSGLEIGAYQPQNFPRDGFIHCSSREQVLKVANSLYRRQTGLVLLEIETGRVAAEIKFENLEGGSELFPHIYGKLNIEAVKSVRAFTSQPDGNFTFPTG